MIFFRGEETILRLLFSGLFAGTLLNMVLFWLIIPIFKDLKPIFISKFEVYKAGAKQEALDKVDDQLLK
jgi:hypothetical protein